MLQKTWNIFWVNSFSRNHFTQWQVYESVRNKSVRKYKCTEAATGGVLQEKAFLEMLQNSQENTCARVSLLIKFLAEACSFIKKKTQAQMFSCEFWEISKNTFFTEHLWATASEVYQSACKMIS